MKILLFTLFRNRSFRFKLLLMMVVALVIYSLASDLFFYFSTRAIITRNVEGELLNVTNATVNMVNSSVDLSIHNYLRGITEKNLDIMNTFYTAFQEGKISEEEAKALASQVLLSQKIGDSGYIFAVDTTGIMRVHPKEAMIGTDRTGEEIFEQQRQMKTGYMEYDWKNPGEEVARPKALYMAYFEPWDWIISISSYREEFLQLVKISDFRDRILALRFGESGYTSILDSQGNLIVHPNMENSNIYNSQDSNGKFFVREIITAKTGQLTYPWKNPGEEVARDKLAVFDYIPERDWYVVSAIYLDEAYEPLNQAMLQFLIVNTLASLAVVLIVGFVLNLLIKPINAIAQVANQIAAGNIDQQITIQGEDEAGKLAEAFRQMLNRLRQMLESEQNQRRYIEDTVQRYVAHMGSISKGNLASDLQISGNGSGNKDPLVVLGQQLNETTANLRAMIWQIREAAQSLSSASAEILASTTQQASGASEQSAAIAQTTTTVDEVKVIAEQSAARAQEVDQSSQYALEVSRAGQVAVQDTIASMNQIKSRVDGIAENVLSLSEQTQQIGEIINTVSEIASQSNMLALNASVEAARAGEHGAGFAVVAGEVRSLAEQSKAATAQVRSIISEIQKATNATVMATEEGNKGVDVGLQQVLQAQSAIQSLGNAVNDNAQVARQVVSSGYQQRTGIEQIATAMQNINQATTQNLASTRQAEKAAQNLNELARSMTEAIARYKI